ncbi:MAG: threonylcarbamoyl-AMP synthase [Chloroflexi bacterium]|nr:threonylcarbamoyl-AMP synthase [Chloroflexota bacterium]
MQTILLRAAAPSAIEYALELIQRGEVVAIPTDTVYGIAADGYNADAIEKLFVAKERPPHKAIQLLVADLQDLERVATYVSPMARALAEKFWPGGLTLVVTARADLPANLRADTNTVGVRLPDAPVVRELARALGRPLAATSANRSGGANPRTAQDVLNDLGGRIPLILDGGATPGNVASTVLDCTQDTPRVLRVGALRLEDIAQALNLPREMLHE